MVEEEMVEGGEVGEVEEMEDEVVVEGKFVHRRYSNPFLFCLKYKINVLKYVSPTTKHYFSKIKKKN